MAWYFISSKYSGVNFICKDWEDREQYVRIRLWFIILHDNNDVNPNVTWQSTAWLERSGSKMLDDHQPDMYAIEMSHFYRWVKGVVCSVQLFSAWGQFSFAKEFSLTVSYVFVYCVSCYRGNKVPVYGCHHSPVLPSFTSRAIWITIQGRLN